MKAMILAAGLGQRMRPLTDHTPKPLLCAGGKPLIEYHLENLARAGIREVLINLAYLGDKIRAHLGDGSAYGLTISYSAEPEPLETGGAIYKALDFFAGQTFLLINGDVWCDIEFSDFIHTTLTTLTTNHLGHLLLVTNPEFHPRGDFLLAKDSTNNSLIVPDSNLEKNTGTNTKTGTKTSTESLQDSHPTCARFTFAGISLLHPDIIGHYPEARYKFPLAEALRYAIAQQKVSGQVYTGHWSDVGTPERLAELNKYLESALKK